MINEEISNKAINLEIRLAKLAAKELLKELQKLMKALEKEKISFENYLQKNGNQVKLKDMVKKGQLEEINVKDGELKELKKELNKLGVKFSVMKDKETQIHSVFFQAKDTTILNKSFQKVLTNIEKKEKNKESIRKNIDKFKEMAKDTISKDKIKNKNKEQSL